MNNPLTIIIKSEKSWLKFSNPSEIITTHQVNNVADKLKIVDEYIRKGKYIAGFISYEAAAGLDPALTTKDPGAFPVLVFGVFDDPIILEFLPYSNQDFEMSSWTPSQTEKFYNNNIKIIKNYIAKGVTYQVNYTLRLLSDFGGSAYALFYQLQQNQQAQYACYMEFEGFRICSASPELFFSLDDKQLSSRPMKGTAARGLSYEQDIQQRENLFNSTKERAENLMIVDMIRNDMGKICDPGSVIVKRLFNTERYPTIWQMTSDVQGRTEATFSEILTALFPCASITGAPKVRTMELINELEQTPRHIYTGSMGYFSPDRQARFNVAIRTVLLDIKQNKAEYGIGSGIVWDSIDKNEYRECLLKARILNESRAAFSLLETMRAEKDGIFLLDYHFGRLKKSAEYFNFVFKEDEIRKSLEKYMDGISEQKKIRLLLAEDGNVIFEQYPLSEIKMELKVALARQAVNSKDLFLYHKTTNRLVYQQAVQQAKEQNVDDVIMFNENGEITEAIIANVVIEKNNVFYTPPLHCGLLNGTFRQYLVQQNKIREKTLFREDLQQADGLFLINSLKKWQKVSLEAL